MTELLACYGGTFDPVHYGHLKPLHALAQQLALTRITLIPNNLPPHRPQPAASSEQRLAMLQLAIADDPLFRIDPRELQRPTPSYTVETLQQLRQQHPPPQPLAFIIGQDSLNSFPHWHQPRQILACSHLIVCRRPGLPAVPASWLQAHLTCQPDDLRHTPAGKIYLANTPLYPISASDIRARCQQHLPCHHLLPPAVLNYINQKRLYDQ